MSPSPRRRWPRSFALVGALVLCGCAPLQTQDRAAAAGAASGADVVVPNPQLVVQGIPPIPKRIADEVARYTDFRGHAFVDWHPLREEMLVSHRKAGGNTTQIFRVSAAASRSR